MSSCSSCQNTKAPLQCEHCEQSLCKNCLQTIPEGAFSFYTKVPVELSHTRYCPACYNRYIIDAQAKYDEIMTLARDVYIFYLGRKGRLPILSESKKKLSVPACLDKDEILMRIAFQAAELGFNAVIETDLVVKKTRDSRAYQSATWSVTGFPVKVDTKKIDRH